MSTKWVYMFEEVEEAENYVGGDWEAVRSLLGGKGANLAEMTRVGLPVPPGFVVTTEACNAYLAAGRTFSQRHVGTAVRRAESNRKKHR